MSWKVGILSNGLNNTTWVTGVTPIDNPKSVHNRCVIGVSGGFYGVSLLSEFSVVVRAFVIGLSQIPSFFFTLVMMVVHGDVGDLPLLDYA